MTIMVVNPTTEQLMDEYAEFSPRQVVTVE
jgi:hypothetical protein